MSENDTAESEYATPNFDPPIIRARVEQLTIYEIQESDLVVLEGGGSDSVLLNSAIAFISVAISLVVALLTTTARSDVVLFFFIAGIIVGFSGGAVLLVLWRRQRRAIRECIRRIRARLPVAEQ